MKKIILGVIAILLLAVCLFCVATCHASHIAQQEQLRAEQELLFQEEINDVMIPEEWYTQEGYDNVTEWWNSLIEMKEKYSNIASATVSEWGDYLTDEQKDKIQELSKKIQSSHSQKEINNYVWTIESIEAEAREVKEKKEAEIAAAAQAKTTQASYRPSSNYSGSASNFKSAGVIYYNGYRFTYYSSRVLYHYMTPQWTLGSDGIYRDSNGYIIVASSDHSQGTLLDTPFGTGIVRDSGCASGTIDVYVGW